MNWLEESVMRLAIPITVIGAIAIYAFSHG